MEILAEPSETAHRADVSCAQHCCGGGIDGRGAVGVLTRMKQWARTIRRDVLALWLAARDPRVPWYAKAVAAAVAAYALSPVDLIPDVIPVLGYLDDLIIVPLGIVLAVRLVPPDLMVQFRTEAARRAKPVSRAGLIAVVTLWIGAAAALSWLLWPLLP